MQAPRGHPQERSWPAASGGACAQAEPETVVLRGEQEVQPLDRWHVPLPQVAWRAGRYQVLEGVSAIESARVEVVYMLGGRRAVEADVGVDSPGEPIPAEVGGGSDGTVAVAAPPAPEVPAVGAGPVSREARGRIEDLTTRLAGLAVWAKPDEVGVALFGGAVAETSEHAVAAGDVGRPLGS